MEFYWYTPLAIQMNNVLQCKLCGLLCGWDRDLVVCRATAFTLTIPGEVSTPMRGCFLAECCFGAWLVVFLFLSVLTF